MRWGTPAEQRGCAVHPGLSALFAAATGSPPCPCGVTGPLCMTDNGVGASALEVVTRLLSGHGLAAGTPVLNMVVFWRQ